MKFKRSALLLGPLSLVCLALPAAATSAAPRWQSARVASLPTGATGLPNGFLPALSCPSAGNCSAGGAYNDKAGNTQGLVLNEVNGIWKAPTELLAPGQASANPSLTINSISCASAGNCAAVGSFADAKSNGQSFVANEVRGVWQRALEVTLPSSASTTVQNSQVHSVDCSSVGNCAAVGSYFDVTQPTGHAEAFEVTQVRGVWGPAHAITLPTNTNVDPFVTINQVACAGVGNCVAVGSYINSDNATQGLVVSQVNGAWNKAAAVVLPGNASAYPSAALSELTCLASNYCTAIGTYTNATGDIEGMIVSETHGAWARAIAMSMPSGAAANPHTFFYGYGGLSCASVGNCSAGGQYLAGNDAYEGFLIDEVHGTWRAATEMVLPAGSKMAGRNGGVVAVSCGSVGNCSAGAAYLDGSSSYQALVINEVAGRWRTGVKITLPTGSNTVGIDGGVYGLICHAQGPCTATGSYQRNATTYEGFTVTTG